MASVIKHGKVWRVQIKVGKTRASNTFSTEDAAREWGRALETKLRKRAELKELLDVGASLPNFPGRIVQAMLDSPLSPEQIIAAAIPTSVICGVYFLIRGERIVYVGQSKNVLRRIARHMDDGREFDRFSVSPCNEHELDGLERTYITALYPDENMSLGNVSK
ncbi:GIY-YIG nuclease family protein [Paraburkholderia atlantica]|uniref:GIY-YIG nuclease family protein n=1 Tax=Paraburkholderia atlantica TaxID=2654982 RepID=UPI00161A62D5|nr:GIY-YIG nuclease family protein [Paraburkholderia atlantica]MBB5509543.1 hypothetical protein [Paraburkholderia atlantica]